MTQASERMIWVVLPATELTKENADKWDGYDFSGMFGFWNSDLQPRHPEEIDYICSTVVLACLYYSGVELDAAKRGVYSI